MGEITYEIAFTLAKHLEKWVKSIVPSYEVGRINRILKRPFGRLIHYHSSLDFDHKNKEEAVYWHSDTSSLTTLCSPIYLDKDGHIVPSMTDEPEHGLEILKRDGSVNSCCIPSDCIALQIGEIFQILSGGKLEATPHRVVATKYPNYTREQFANFILQQFDQILSIPQCSTEEDVFRNQSDKVPDLRVRWKNGDSCKLLIDNSFDYFSK
jgi:isopenicillin N synthase-like dioxygenase